VSCSVLSKSPISFSGFDPGRLNEFSSPTGPDFLEDADAVMNIAAKATMTTTASNSDLIIVAVNNKPLTSFLVLVDKDRGGF